MANAVKKHLESRMLGNLHVRFGVGVGVRVPCLHYENEILREKLGTKRVILNDNQRMRLARLGRRLGRKVLSEACCAFSPDTILMWHRKLIARKYDGSGNRKGGKKRITPELEELIIMFA